jgi:uronate dehydrogenase
MTSFHALKHGPANFATCCIGLRSWSASPDGVAERQLAARSGVVRDRRCDHAPMPVQPTVAVTGACGRIGRVLVEHLAERRYPLTLVDRPDRGLGRMAGLGDVNELELADPSPPGLFEGAEVVIHLAGQANQNASWESLLPDNVQASYNVATAAMRARCRRLIVASSVHAVMASARRPVAADDPVAPLDLYGVTKCFVEALAFWCAHRGEMSAAAVRIGGFQDVEARRASGAESFADVFIAAPDLISLLERAINAEYRFAILHAAAPGPGVLLDTRSTEQLLGWSAQHRFS